MSDVEIRPTITADLDALADVLIRVHVQDGYPVEGVQNPRSWLELSDPIGQWTALRDDAPVGHVAMMRPASDDRVPREFALRHGLSISEMALLARLFVDPSARGRSLANRLVGEVEEHARSLKLKLMLEVMIKDRAAIALYESRGWSPVGNVAHVHDLNTTPALVMIAPT